MNTTTKTVTNRFAAPAAAFVAATAFAASVASAVPSGATSPASIFIAEDALVTITFDSSSAGWSGNLHRIEAGSQESLSDGLGVALLNNHSSSRGDSVDLGFVAGGTDLMFAYDVVTGQRNTFRMDDESGDGMFATAQPAANTWTLYVEDWINGDYDYNDAVFTVTASPVPAPAALATAGLCLVGAGSRRRRA